MKSEGRGWAVFYPNQDCGYTRIYRFKPSKNLDIRRDYPWEEGIWKHIQSEVSLMNILSTTEYCTIFERWKEHQLKVNSSPTQFAEGRLENTIVDKAILVSKGNGCAVCGGLSNSHATTTLSEERTVMLSISLCENHRLEADEYPCILNFFGTLFSLHIDIPDLIKLDHIPDTLITPLADIIAAHLNAQFDKPEKRENGWNIKFKMQDGWVWRLRLKTLANYGYMLFSPNDIQIHRIDSANHHPDVPFGPSHQHSNIKTERESIEPSFSYGIPLLDFPLLEKIKNYYSQL